MSIFRKKINAGLDIGSHSVHWAATDAKGEDCEVWSAEIHPQRSSKDDNLVGDAYKSRLRSVLRQAEKEVKRWNKSVVVGVQGAHLITSYLEFPQLKDDELDMAVLSSVTREVPFPIDTLEVVHMPVPSLKAGRKAVFCSAWKRAAGDRLRQLCEFCELKVRRLEASGIGLTRELYQNRALDPKRFYVIVNIGFEITQVVLVRAGYPYYLRDIPVGGRDITYAIQTGSKVSWGEAIEIKHGYPLFELTHTAGPILGEISYEVGRSIAYFKKRYGIEEVDSIYLSGGSSLLKDFPEWLEEELRLPVRRETWQQLKARADEDDAALTTVASGLALGQ